MAFPPEFLEELRNRISVSAVVGRRVRLAKKGRGEFLGLCPFHNEKSPSFTVNEDKGFYHCFGCGAHGDALGFEMQINHLSFSDAVERLAQEAGLEVPQATPEQRIREAKRSSLHDATEAATQFYEAKLWAAEGREALAYLRKRGLTDAIIRKFRLGYSPDSREAIKRAIMSEQIPEAMLLEVGLLKKPEGNGPSFDFFRGRVMFPVMDRKNRVVAFGARIMGEGQPKYLNSPDTPLFHKGQTLYGLNFARQMARERNVAVAVEGYMDVIALYQAGFEFAVAPLGTALTEGQMEELWRLCDEPILSFDGDNAGQRAMARASERALPILKPGKSLRFAVLPASEDPDSLIKSQGPQAFERVMNDAQPLFNVVWTLASSNRMLDTPERRAALEAEVKEKAFGIADETVRWQYLNAFREKMRELTRPKFEPRNFDRKQWNSGGGKNWRPGQGPKPVIGLKRLEPPGSPAKRQEGQLLSLLLAHPILIEVFAERLGELKFGDLALDSLRRQILKHLDRARGLDSETLTDQLRSDGFSNVLDIVLDTTAMAVSWPQEVEDAKDLWQHIFTFYTRPELQAGVGLAVERFAQDPSEANLKYLEAMLKTRGRSLAQSDDEN